MQLEGRAKQDDLKNGKEIRTKGFCISFAIFHFEKKIILPLRSNSLSRQGLVYCAAPLIKSAVNLTIFTVNLDTNGETFQKMLSNPAIFFSKLIVYICISGRNKSIITNFEVPVEKPL